MITLEQLEQFRVDADGISNEVTTNSITRFEALSRLMMACADVEIDVTELRERFECELDKLAMEYYCELRTRLGLNRSRRRNVSR